MEENTQQYPTYLPCTKVQWESLNNQANELLGFSNELAKSYSNPIIDKFGGYYFLVNNEVSHLVDLTKCVDYDQIQFNTEIL